MKRKLNVHEDEGEKMNDGAEIERDMALNFRLRVWHRLETKLCNRWGNC